MKYLALFLGLIIAGCSGHDAAQPSGNTVRHWPTQWCKARPGISRDALVALMGPPTQHTSTTLTWTDDHWLFNAFLEDNGSVNQLDVNAAGLTDAEKAGLGCRRARSLDAVEAQAAAPNPKARPACDLVTAEAMSRILGSPVTAEGSGNLAGGQSKCVYTSSAEHGPYAELSVDLGGGEAGMVGAKAAGAGLKGVVNTYDGVGDQAVSVGPALFVRTGNDLVTIVLTGVNGRPALVKTIFFTAKAGM